METKRQLAQTAVFAVPGALAGLAFGLQWELVVVIGALTGLAVMFAFLLKSRYVFLAVAAILVTLAGTYLLTHSTRSAWGIAFVVVCLVFTAGMIHVYVDETKYLKKLALQRGNPNYR